MDEERYNGSSRPIANWLSVCERGRLRARDREKEGERKKGDRE